MFSAFLLCPEDSSLGEGMQPSAMCNQVVTHGSGFAPGPPSCGLHFPGSTAWKAWPRGYGRQQRRVQGVQRDAMAAWAERLAGVRGVLLDISGVLYDSGAGGGAAIAGSVDAVARLVGSTRGVVGLLWLPGAGRSRRPRLLAHWPRPSCWLGARWESLGWHC